MISRVKTLTKLGEKKRKGFWYFYFKRQHPVLLRNDMVSTKYQLRYVRKKHILRAVCSIGSCLVPCKRKMPLPGHGRRVSTLISNKA